MLWFAAAGIAYISAGIAMYNNKEWRYRLAAGMFFVLAGLLSQFGV